MDDLHARLLRIGFAAGDDLGLVLAGGYALSAHNLLSRPSRDIDFATATTLPLPDVATRLADAYRRAGFDCQIVEATPRMARLMVTRSPAACEVDLLKEAIGPPAVLHIGPVLALDDAIGLKVRALHDRAAHRDYIDLRAAHRLVSWPELEGMGARHTAGFSLEELADRLGAIEELDIETFAAYQLKDQEIAELRRWALEWEADIRTRLASGETGPSGIPDDEWDTYLDAR
ncbi:MULTISPECIES: nucleotidyl transferase AbiEii/AbiGii toxin family protein [Micromonospora]|uniref:nucleotidyl transferase AbiEii/AbiGii toxin family protein n=1 Tax=Micromonospora TaxID=1873 RepID=UPI00131A1CD7|nr:MULTISPECIES: nucleotidyl transferase AbiEii/AbiGii toxin family protein [Micromonospora]NES16948.1 nucleotidyl transferase AbiEii/AbiGii toxin family protein [Micromonospora sp. PPF5-17B]NES38278.1 nucleotidyl transferase AbiEii/AbiGii toxin family protein [Micromonospora solifontis]NES58652.1 nucleotidyl transferase AbiEii/AbiGii toxin family protein [Micromonospora sp. PPF5-6]